MCTQRYFKHVQIIKDITTDCCELPYFIVFLPHKNTFMNYTQTAMLVGNLIKRQAYSFVFWKVQRFLIFEVRRLATLVNPYSSEVEQHPSKFVLSISLENSVKIRCSMQPKAKKKV